MILVLSARRVSCPMKWGECSVPWVGEREEALGRLGGYSGYLYCPWRGIPAGRWGDRSDEIIKRSGFKSSDVRIWGDDPCDWGTPASCGWRLKIIAVHEHFISEQSEHGLLPPHSMGQVKTAYQSRRQMGRPLHLGIPFPSSTVSYVLRGLDIARAG